MFEFEIARRCRRTQKMEIELCEHLGLPDLTIETYEDWTNMFNAKNLIMNMKRRLDMV